MSDPILFATQYVVSALPRDHDNADSFWITVQWRGRRRPPYAEPGSGEWAVVLRSYVLDDRDRWDLEPQPSARTPEWCAKHRFTLAEAIVRAKRMLPTVTVNGMYVDDGQVCVRPNWLHG